MGVFDFLKGGKKEEGTGGEFDFEPSSGVGGPGGGREQGSSRGRGGGPTGPGGTNFGPPSGTKGGKGGGLPGGGSQRREGPTGPGGSFGPPGRGGSPGPSERTGRGGPTGPSRGGGMGSPREQRPGTGRSMAPPTPGQGKGAGQQDLKRTMRRILGKLDEMNRTLKNIKRELGRR